LVFGPQEQKTSRVVGQTIWGCQSVFFFSVVVLPVIVTVVAVTVAVVAV
jgi:hypothetical protein